MSSITRLESIYRDLEKEHRRVMKLMERLRAEASSSSLTTTSRKSTNSPSISSVRGRLLAE